MAIIKDYVIGTLSQIALLTLDPDIVYEITDYPVGGITNALMASALTPTYNAFFHAGEVFVCEDMGTYLKGRAYKFTGVGWDLVTEFDSAPTYGSLNPVTSDGLKNAIMSTLAKTGEVTISAPWDGTAQTLTITGVGTYDNVLLCPKTKTDMENAQDCGLYADPVITHLYGTTAQITITADSAITTDIVLLYTIIRGTN